MLGRRRLEVDAKRRGQSVESAVVPLADGAELPSPLVTIEIPEHQGARSAGRLEIEADQFIFASQIREGAETALVAVRVALQKERATWCWASHP